VITCFYVMGFLLTLGVGAPRPQRDGGDLALGKSLWHDLREGFAYLWDTPSSLAALWLAFLVNLTAFPMTSGLLPYVAREVYHVNQTGLGYLIASFAFGALLGSILISVVGRSIRPARMMIIFALGWYATLLVFVQMHSPLSGSLTLIVAGLSQSLSLVPMSAMLLHGAGAFRGRVMGMRMLAIYGLPIGLMASGALIDRIGFAPTATLYCSVGMALTLLIALHWRTALWPLHAPANAR
jgi:predicted MFS family arabinose efflux permease